MTEKRFTIKGTWGKSLNRLKGVICDNNNDMYITDVVYLLNSLSDENGQLKSEIEKLSYANEDLLEEKRIWKQMSDEYTKVSDENEQLRKDATTLIYANQDYRHENEHLKSENKRLTDKLNKIALEFLNYDMVTMGKATEISEMCYYDFLKYRKENGNPMELQ